MRRKPPRWPVSIAVSGVEPHPSALDTIGGHSRVRAPGWVGTSPTHKNKVRHQWLRPPTTQAASVSTLRRACGRLDVESKTGPHQEIYRTPAHANASPATQKLRVSPSTRAGAFKRWDKAVRQSAGYPGAQGFHTPPPVPILSTAAGAAGVR